jgi:hypothetical protein
MKRKDVIIDNIPLHVYTAHLKATRMLVSFCEENKLDISEYEELLNIYLEEDAEEESEIILDNYTI